MDVQLFLNWLYMNELDYFEMNELNSNWLELDHINLSALR